MLCQKCGENLHPEAKFCSTCGVPAFGSLEGTGSLSSEKMKNTIEAKAIWNPNAASSWSLIFTPAFGSYLQALNWQTLGEEDKAERSMVWFYVSVSLLLAYVMSVLFFHFTTGNAKTGELISRILPLPYLIIWYYFSGRDQAKYVKLNYNDNYVRKSWGRPLIIGVLSMLGYWILAFVIGIVMGIVMART